LIPQRGQISANGVSLEAASVWIADEPVDVVMDEAGDLLIAYEGAASSGSG
jgi:hypothetical protein